MAEGETPSLTLMEKKLKTKPILDSKVIAELRESKLTVGDFAKRYGMKRRSK